ncbi:MAG: hypothetical protein V3U04_01925 [Candidatus Aerophobetes bacterium]
MAKKKRESPRTFLDGDNLLVDAKFEFIGEKMTSETVDILASMICDYFDRKKDNEKEQDS